MGIIFATFQISGNSQVKILAFITSHRIVAITSHEFFKITQLNPSNPVDLEELVVLMFLHFKDSYLRKVKLSVGG